MKTTISLNRGFTLVEIIGLLSAVAIPNYNMARKTAQDTGCLKQLHIIWGTMIRLAIEKGKNGSDRVPLEDIERLLGRKPRCPGAGEYILGTFDDKPRCIVHGFFSDFHLK